MKWNEIQKNKINYKKWNGIRKNGENPIFSAGNLTLKTCSAIFRVSSE